MVRVVKSGGVVSRSGVFYSCKSCLKITESDRALSRQNEKSLPVHNATAHISNQRLQRHTILQPYTPHRKNHGLRLILTIDRDDDRLFLELACKDVSLIVKKEIDQTPGTHRRMLTSQTNPRACPVKHLLLLCSSSFSLKRTRRKIATIVRILSTFHRDFFTGIKLRDATHAENKRRVHHRTAGRSSFQ